MSFELPALPYAKDALAPHISAETLEYHYPRDEDNADQITDKPHIQNRNLISNKT